MKRFVVGKYEPLNESGGNQGYLYRLKTSLAKKLFIIAKLELTRILEKIDNKSTILI